MNPDLYGKIPAELRGLDQWVVWRYVEKENADPSKPAKKDKPLFSARTGTLASTTDPSTWASFEQAAGAQLNGPYDGIGFVFQYHDPYCVIDLDAVDDPELRQRQMKIASCFDTYQEISPSGEGLHIILRGSVKRAVKRNWIEIYSTHRYITFTGNIFRDAPINQFPIELESLWSSLQTISEYDVPDLSDTEQRDEDRVIYDRACTAVNGNKFLDFWNGNYSEHLTGVKANGQEYDNSASAGDMALIDMLVFYTQNYDQVRRMFMSSPAGHRKKVIERMRTSDKYVRDMYNKALDRAIQMVNVDKLQKRMQQKIDQKKAVTNTMFDPSVTALQPTTLNQPPAIRPSTHTQAMVPTSVDDMPFTLPSGLVGDMAKFIFNKSFKPVPELALAASLGLMAGICGRSYTAWTGTGLNLYLLILANTGIGKEGMTGGINALIEACKMQAPSAKEYVGPGVFASGQGVVNYLAQESKSFVSILNEFGLLWERLNRVNASAADQDFVQTILQLYGESKRGGVFRKKVFSDSKNNLPEVLRPAMSFVGVATSQTFMRACDTHTVETGFLPRLMVIDYKGKRPRDNEFAVAATPDPDLIHRLTSLMNISQQYNQNNQDFAVTVTNEVKDLSRAFSYQVDDVINEMGDSNPSIQIWNRANENAIKLATLLAIGDNCFAPCVQKHNWDFAYQFVNRNVNLMTQRFETTHIGLAKQDYDQMKTLQDAIQDYASTVEPYTDKFTKSYGMNPTIYRMKVLTRRYLVQKLQRKACFKDAYGGPTKAIEGIIRQAIDNGIINQVTPAACQNDLKTSQKCYGIVDESVDITYL